MADIKALTADDPSLLQSAQAAYRRYNEEQLATVKLPGGSEDVSQCADASDENIRFLQDKSRFSSARTIPWATTDITMWRARACSRSITMRGCADSIVPYDHLSILTVL